MEVTTEQETAAEPSLRESLEAAFDEHSEAAEKPTETTATPAESAPADSPVKPDAGDQGDRPRDEHGRFAPKKPETGDHGAAPVEGGTQQGAGTPPPAAPVVVEKAPQSWKPLAREHWAALPPDVRAEVQRREGEVARALQESAQARHVADQFQATARQYLPPGQDPVQAATTLFQFEAALRTAPQGRRAELAANLIRQYGVDIAALDAALAGQAPQQAAPPPQDPRVDQLLAQIQQAQAARTQAVSEAGQREVEGFGKDREFFEDVREDMADIIEIAAKRGQPTDLQSVYDRACSMNPDVSKIVAQREAAKGAATARAATQRNRAAASSVRSTPTSPIKVGKPGSLREEIEEAMHSLSGR